MSKTPDGLDPLREMLNTPFKQPWSRRRRASVRRQDAAMMEAIAPGADTLQFFKSVAKLSVGDVFKGDHGRQVVLDKEPTNGFCLITYRKVRKDGSIIEAGESVTTTLKANKPIQVLDTIDVPPHLCIINNSGDETPQKGSTQMAKTVTRKSAGKTSTKKSDSKSTTTKAKSAGSSNGKVRRTAEDIAALVPKFVAHLTDGGTMRALKQEHGFSDDGPIRAALYREGYDSKGNKHGETRGSIDAGKAAGKKQLVALRANDGAAWFRLAFLADITEAEAKRIVEEAGGPTGRVYVKTAEDKPKGKGKATTAKAKAKAKAADPS
jgi:hypothetical protein